jgi:FkbM family methyltransferase
MMERRLSDRFHAQLMRAATRYEPGRRDHLRAEVSGGRLLGVRRALRELKDRVLVAADQAGFILWTPAGRASMRTRLDELDALIPSFEQLFGRLVDERSRDLLVELLVFRVLGHSHMTLSTSTPTYWGAYHDVDSRFRQPEPPLCCGTSTLPRYRVPGRERAISLHTHPLSVLNTFLIEQYACRRPGFICEAAPGETVIDGGGCWGDTALYFANRVGKMGRVHVFEFVPSNLEVLYSNIAANPDLSDVIDVIEHPIWHRADEDLRFSSSGPGTRVGSGTGELSARGETIDHLVETGRIRHVDLIKLDVEGAERNALQGAQNTIRAMRPRLAISAYHRMDDFAVIPQLLDATGVHYRFALDHFTVHQEETVIFAVPEEMRTARSP